MSDPAAIRPSTAGPLTASPGPARSSTARAALRRLVAVALVLIASVIGLAVPAAAEARPDRVTAAQERVVLRLIDDICGDTWCEGDHAFRFRRLSCHPQRSSCRLVVQIASWSEEPLRWRWRAAPVHGAVRYADMVTTGPSGERSLQPTFFSAVGDAVRALEATVACSRTAPVRPAVGSAHWSPGLGWTRSSTGWRWVPPSMRWCP